VTEPALWMFPVLMAAIFSGVPVAFALMSVAFVFGLWQFGGAAVTLFEHKLRDITSSHVLAAAPLFIFMGAMLERSGIAERLFEAIHLWTRRLPGGLAVGTILMCVVFAASSGVVGATETVVGMLAVPVMLRHRYDKGLISGTICAGGSLGSIIPPSVLVVFLALIADLGIGELFVAMLLPGLILAGCYLVYIVTAVSLNRSVAPGLEELEELPSFLRRLWLTAVGLAPPLLLIVAVLGSIMMALAVPTEAAALGAVGSLLLSIVYRRFSLRVLRDALVKTISITSMILTIVVGGTMFGGVFVGAGGQTALESLLADAAFSPWGTLALILLLVFLAGFVMDLLSIMLVLIPIAMPIVTGFGFDPVWFSIALLIMMQTSLLTPPMAGAIFYFRAIAPPEITLKDMYRGVVPFIALHFVVLGLLIAFPGLALWLPSVLLGFD
jgi:tripartite ATP-independent transporter DctM subunit